MAGFGDRFKRAGYKDPKPLIMVDGKPMIEHVIDLFPEENNFLFVCNNDHLKHSNMRGIISSAKPKGKIAGIKSERLGPVRNILLVADYIDDNEPVIVNYCDFNMFWNYSHFKKEMLRTKADGAVVCYSGFHPHLLGPSLYAGVKIDSKKMITDIREKYSFSENKMDSWHSCGTYYFKTGGIMKKYFQKIYDSGEKVNNEFYVSMAFKPMIRDGLKVTMYPVDYFCQWGTPEDLSDYNYWSEYFKSKHK